MDYIFGVMFPNQNKYQYFLANYEVNQGELVICNSPRGLELGKIATLIKEYTLPAEGEEIPFTYIERIASEEDVENFKKNQDECLTILKSVQEQSDNLALGMKITSTEYTLDRNKLIISFLADNRVDFRDLLKVLASMYHCRIELSQIGSRDKAKMIGGLGTCGLPLCCSTFLNEFDGISITMAKNQMLTLNIPKLSGQCGKLICCLKFEDEMYTEAKKDFPRVGLRVKYEDNIYKITSFNIMTKIVRLEGNNTILNLPLSQIEDKILYNYNPNQNRQEKKDNKNKDEKK